MAYEPKMRISLLKMKFKLGLGLGFMVLLPIFLAYVYDFRSFSAVVADHYDNGFMKCCFVALIVICVGFCVFFGRLLHYMLPRKRDGEGVVVANEETRISEGNESLNTSSASIVKKHRISATESEANIDNSAVVESAADNGSNKSSSTADAKQPIMAFGDSNQTDIDEDLHSRQLAVYGRETMRRLFASNILVSGMQGLGTEIGMHFFLLFPVFIIF